VCVIALLIRLANRFFSAPYYIVACGLTGCTVIFATLSHKRYDFRGRKKLLRIKCVFRFCLQLLSETLSRSKKNSARHYHKCVGFLVCSLFLSDFNETYFSLTDLRKIFQVQNFQENLLVGAELFHMVRQTNQIIAFLKVTKGKSIPLQAWTGPWVSRRSRLPDFKTFDT